MSPRFLLAPLCSLFLAGGGAAQPPEREEIAQATCNLLDRIIAASANDYAEHRGRALGPDLHEVTLSLAAFRSCTVTLRHPTMYSCTRVTRSEAETESLYGYALRTAERCLTGWRETPLFDAEAPGLEKIKAMRVNKTYDFGEVSFGIVHARDTRGETPIDLLSLVVGVEKGSPLAF